MTQPKFNKVIRFIGVYLIVNIFALGLLILVTGIWPITVTGWIILVTLGFPAWLFGEYIGEKLLSHKLSNAIDSSEKKLSFFRMGSAFITMVFFLAFISGIYYYFKGFWIKHFINWHLTTG